MVKLQENFSSWQDGKAAEASEATAKRIRRLPLADVKDEKALLELVKTVLDEHTKASVETRHYLHIQSNNYRFTAKIVGLKTEG